MRDACSCSATTAGAPLRPRVRAPPRLERPFHGLRTLGITPPGRGPGCALARIAPETAARAAQRSLSMRYLVTGGAGFIGSHLVEHLVTSRHEVVVLDDFSSGSRENLAAVAHRVRLVTGSVADASACAEAMRGVHFVLHHAALTSVVGSVADPVAADRVNVAGTVAVLHAAREAGVRRVVLANMLACTAPAERVAGEVYNIGCGGSVTINEVWERIQQALDISLLARHAPARAGEVRDSQAGIEKAARDLGYRPSVDFGAGLRLTVAAYARRWQPEVATSQVRVSGGRRPSVTPQDAAWAPASPTRPAQGRSPGRSYPTATPPARPPAEPHRSGCP